MLSSSYKIPGGKLVKVKLWVDAVKIERITILGDFFLHPEETIQALENALVGTELNVTSIESIISKVMSESNASLIGATIEDLVTTIMIAWDSH
jgi:lipoate-protein ligase A